ncbi:MAG: hypothetical protein HC833_12230 [Leptolyngbyaceae cyanobacterium RM1_406_9]|nr:hypothetical protein [Leptolyngbyaceae cyanobacterium SM1_4_3]NJN91871.1 hypothetical protein [Leptolyngbyaceae cyanobacterium SL_5_14]NJO74450.1 hypothetical protein [Leptolyngbyaceae cyanobacterium RM1_406_9]
MTQSLPTQPKATSDKAARHQRLLELVEAEDAANGEVGCGRDLGKGLSGYLSIRGVVLDDEQLKSLLREHLGHILMEPDFDSITTQIQHRLESLVVQSLDSSSSSASLLDSTNIIEHIPTEALKELFQSQLAEFCSEATLEQLIQFSHQIIHKAVLRPRHTWSNPIWVLRSETQIYIAQTAGIEEAIAKVKTQHPQETGKLEVITVGGILAPDQVISLDTNLLQSPPPK